MSSGTDQPLLLGRAMHSASPGEELHVEVGGLGPVTPEQVSTEQRIRVWMERLTVEQGIQFTPEGTLRKMKEEWQEFLDDPDDEMELADLVITCIAHAQTRGWRLGIAVADKMKINEARVWVSQPDGTIHHE
jgi:NTP pyrophosphatase (non-canonical NTP hydrolase)